MASAHTAGLTVVLSIALLQCISGLEWKIRRVLGAFEEEAWPRQLLARSDLTDLVRRLLVEAVQSGVVELVDQVLGHCDKVSHTGRVYLKRHRCHTSANCVNQGTR